MKAIAYCRVSTEGQIGDDKFGIASQKEMIMDYAKRNNIEIVDWFIDEAISGAKESRPAFDMILNGEVTNPPVECIIVAKTDRIARDINLYYAYKAQLQRMNLEIRSVSEDWSAQDKLTAMILENFLAMVATIERENIKLRTSGGRRIKAKAGGYAGGKAPMGYKVADGRLEVVPDEAEVVRVAFSCKWSGYTMKATCEELKRRGFKTRGGKDFSISTIQSIWGNEQTYRGNYKYGAGDWVKGQHEAIL